LPHIEGHTGFKLNLNLLYKLNQKPYGEQQYKKNTEGKWELIKINPEKCTACGMCIKSCPKDVIDMVPYHQDVVITCNNKETGKVVRPKCSVACIACKICVKACPFEAIDFDNNLAFIDYEKCTNCFVCVEKCPTKAIEGNFERRNKNQDEV